MRKKINEAYNLNPLRLKEVGELNFALAEIKDCDRIFELMSLRNPDADQVLLRQTVEREIKEFSDGKRYGVFVARHREKVIGFCRFFFSSDVPQEKIKHPYRDGCYCMGMITDPEYRRRGISKFLSMKRFEWLRSINVREVFSMVAADNLTSIDMHKSFGFEEIERGEGFLSITFECGEGILYQRKLENLRCQDLNGIGLR